ncbi:hypothetical protein PCE1_004567 [Barthelona sp. PCE]
MQLDRNAIEIAELQGHMLTICLVEIIVALTFLASSKYSFLFSLPIISLALVGIVGSLRLNVKMLGVYSILSLSESLVIFAALFTTFMLIGEPFSDTQRLRLSLGVSFLMFEFLVVIVSVSFYRYICHDMGVVPVPDSQIKDFFLYCIFLFYRIVGFFRKRRILRRTENALLSAADTPSPDINNVNSTEKCTFCGLHRSNVLSLDCGHFFICSKCLEINAKTIGMFCCSYCKTPLNQFLKVYRI